MILMQILENNLEEIKRKAETMSDFLKMEYLELCAQKFIDFYILKYCHIELIRLYKSKLLYLDALKYLAKLQSMSLSDDEKSQLFINEMEILIKGGYYDRVDGAYKNAVKFTDDVYLLRRKIIELYNSEAEKFEKANKNQSLLRIYEKLIPMLNDDEKDEYKKKLLVVYKKLGKVKESLALEKNIA